MCYVIQLPQEKKTHQGGSSTVADCSESRPGECCSAVTRGKPRANSNSSQLSPCLSYDHRGGREHGPAPVRLAYFTRLLCGHNNYLKLFKCRVIILKKGQPSCQRARNESKLYSGSGHLCACKGKWHVTSLCSLRKLLGSFCLLLGPWKKLSQGFL